jgi:hypothetical protein
VATIGDNGKIDPSKGSIISIFGRMRSGKSVMGLTLFRSSPGDRIVLDVAGDDGPEGEDILELEGQKDDLPAKWPEWRRDGDKPMTLRYVPDPGSPTYLEDMDAVVGLALARGECCLLVHEVLELAPAGRTPPNTRRALGQGRHKGATTQIYCGPRTQGINPLVIAQSDLVYCFELKKADDRDVIADNIGWDKREYSELVVGLRPYEHLVYDQNVPAPEPGADDDRLAIYQPLPAAQVESTLRWAKGYRPKREQAMA